MSLFVVKLNSNNLFHDMMFFTLMYLYSLFVIKQACTNSDLIASKQK